MNFDRVARIYRLLEAIAFGGALQRARVRWLEVCRNASSALIIGEGDGRFLCQLFRVNPSIKVDCVEASGGMIVQAWRRLGVHSIDGAAHVDFIQNDVRSWQPSKSYDLLVTHFVLDCFEEGELEQLVRKLARAIAPGGAWLVADFKIPARGWGRWYGRLLVRVMYAFFRAATGLRADHLADPVPFLVANELRCAKRETSLGGIVSSEVWVLRGSSG